MRKSVNGFTIVELLIVIVVIAILAAISVVAYTGIQNRTYDSTVQSDLKNLATKFEVFKVESSTSTYPTPGAQLNSIGFEPSKSAYQTSGTNHNLTYCYASDYSAYIVTARSKSGAIYYVSSRASAPRSSTSGWDNSNAQISCNTIEPSVTTSNNLRGYASEDTVTGPWRDWVGGN